MAKTELRAIQAGEVIPLEVFKRITGYGESAMRTMRRAGLPVRYIGGRGVILGSEYMAFVQQQPISTECRHEAA